ncbi:hypothetical protein B0H19DRAFT_1106166 [Mycena capillaripes]|nr:hypothetical protein B0H19DRAFT_1106166 [Mycena capillaripes]
MHDACRVGGRRQFSRVTRRYQRCAKAKENPSIPLTWLRCTWRLLNTFPPTT